MNVPLIGEDSGGEPQPLKVRTSNSSQIYSSRSSDEPLRRDNRLSVPMLGPMLVVACGLALGSCSSVSGYVSDTWPTWAGGMPKDVPPRPGAPGYEEFLAHQQRQDAAASSPADANTQTTSVVASPNKTGGRPPPANQPMDISGGGQGGLY
jgi:hypothetical protein